MIGHFATLGSVTNDARKFITALFASTTSIEKAASRDGSEGFSARAARTMPKV